MSGSGRMGWEASLPLQPLHPGRGVESIEVSRAPDKHFPAVPSVQKALVEHLQRAYPILDAAIVRLIVEEQGEEHIDEVVKTLSSLAADAEREAEESRVTKLQLQGPAANPDPCMDDKVAIEMAIAASLADQKAQHSNDNWESGAEWESLTCWKTTDSATAAEWGSALPHSASWEKAEDSKSSASAIWDGGVLLSADSSLGLPHNSPLSEGKSQPVPKGEQADLEQLSNAVITGSSVQTMTTLLGDGMHSASGQGSGKDARVDMKIKARAYTPRLITELCAGGGKSAGFEEEKDQDSRLSVQVSQPSKQEKSELAVNNDPEDDEAQRLKQLKMLFPDLTDMVICRAYIDADSDVNRAAEVLLNLESIDDNLEKHDKSPTVDTHPEALPKATIESGNPSYMGASSTPKALGSVLSAIVVAKPLLKEKSVSPGDKQQLQPTEPTTLTLGSNLVPSRQHPKLFQEDESTLEPSSSFSSRPVSPYGSTGSLSEMSTPTHSSPEDAGSKARARRNKKKGRRSASSSRGNSEEDESIARSDMVGFMVSMLGGSVPPAVVKDVIENLNGDFQQSCKCLLSMSAGSEGGIIGEDLGAMTDGSESSGDAVSKVGLDAEEDPLPELTSIFGCDKLETIEQVLKEKGGNVGDAATVLMAMFDSEKEVFQESDGKSFKLTTDWITDARTVHEDEEVDPNIKIKLEQLLAHFPLADKSAVQSLLHITDNSFEETAKMLYDSGLMPRGLDIASLTSQAPSAQANGHHLSHQQPLPSQLDTRRTAISPSCLDRGRPPGRPVFPERQSVPAHLQRIFRADEFPEIGEQSAPYRDAAEEGALLPEGQNALFLKNRSATNKHWRACQYFFSEAARARANREFSRAEALKEKGRQHKRLAEAANQVASSKIFMEKNKTFRNTIKIDVHGQLVQEALKHVDDHLKTLSNLTTISYLSIITGRGLHSENGKAKILPAVQKYLRERGYSFYQENPGCIVVDLKAQRDVPSGPLSADDADDRPSSAESFEERSGRVTDSGSGQALHRKLNLA